MSSGDIFLRTFAIENNVRGFPQDIDSIHDILARRTDGKSDVEGHNGRGIHKMTVMKEREEGMGG